VLLQSGLCQGKATQHKQHQKTTQQMPLSNSSSKSSQMVQVLVMTFAIPANRWQAQEHQHDALDVQRDTIVKKQ